jgi:hypothetical protein
MMRHVVCAWLLGVAALAAGGCSGSGVKKVTGTVRLDGTPLEGADVQFEPKDKADLALGSFGGRTDADGKFTIAIGPGTGRNARPGKFVVVITKGQAIGRPPADDSREELEKSMRGTAPGASRSAIPAKYGDPAQSPFVVDIQEGTNELPPFELQTDKKKKR